MSMVLSERQGTIAILTLNNPNQYNALGGSILRDLSEALDAREPLRGCKSVHRISPVDSVLHFHHRRGGDRARYDDRGTKYEEAFFSQPPGTQSALLNAPMIRSARPLK